MSGKAVGSFIIGAAFIGAAILTGGLTTIAGSAFLANAIPSLLLAYGTGRVAGALATSLASKQRGMEVNTASNIARLPIVYGRAKMGIRYADVRVDPASTNRDTLYIVGALCHGSQTGLGIEAIEEIYFDNRLAVNAAGTVQAPFTGKLTVTKYLGTSSQAVDSTLNTKFPTQWPSSSQGRGVAYLVLKLTFDADVYPTGIPNVTALVKGRKVYDPRTALYAYSTNPVLCLRDYLTDMDAGAAASAAGEIVEQSFIDEANYAEELVEVPGPAATEFTITAATAASPIVCTKTAHGLATNDRISVRQLGATAVGLTGLIGYHTVTVIDANNFSLNSSAGTGTYAASSAGATELIQQTRFACNGIVDTSEEPRENARKLATSCRGIPVWEGGRIRLFIRKASVAQALKLTEDTIIGGWSFRPLGIQDAPNLARVTFINPLKNYQPDIVEWPRPGSTNAYLAEDNDFETSLDIELPFTTDKYTAEQIAMVSLREARKGLPVSLNGTEETLAYGVGDTAYLTHATPGWTDKQFWIMGMKLAPDGSTAMALLEYDVNAYSLDPSATFPSLPGTGLPDPYSCAAPTGLTLTGVPEASGEGYVSRIKAAWTRAVEPFLDGYEVQMKLSAQSLWTDIGTPLRDDVTFYSPPLTELTTWDLRIRAVNTLGVPSAWVSSTISVDPLGKVLRFPWSNLSQEPGGLVSVYASVDLALDAVKIVNGAAPPDGADYQGSFQIPKGVTITALRAKMRRHAAGDLAKTILYKNGTAIATATHTGGLPSDQTVVATCSQLVGDETYSIRVELIAQSNTNDVRFYYAEVEYDMPTYDKTY